MTVAPESKAQSSRNRYVVIFKMAFKPFFFFHLNEMNEFYLVFITSLLFVVLVDFNNESYCHI